MNAHCAIKWDYTHTFSTPGGFGTSQDGVVRSGKVVCGNGTGATQVNVAWHDKRTLDGTVMPGLGYLDVLDLSGILQTAWLETIVFTGIKALLVENLGDPADDVPNPSDRILVYATAPNGWDTLFSTGGIAIRGGAWAMFGIHDSDTIGYAVTAGTGDKLTVENLSAGTVEYVIALVGIGT